MNSFEINDRNRVRRLPDRGRYDKETLYRIVDEALICHVGFVVDGRPFVIPTLHARQEDEILLHGASSSRLIRHLQEGGEVCIGITHIDGIVLARSVFNHSINYRSAVIFGRGKSIEGDKEKTTALAAFTEKLLPGRWADARLPNEKELKATGIVAVEIDSASAKVRSGPPGDDEADYDLPYWAGVLPLRLTAGDPEADSLLSADAALPDYVLDFVEKRR